jgi:hypothetical protein
VARSGFVTWFAGIASPVLAEPFSGVWGLCGDFRRNLFDPYGVGVLAARGEGAIGETIECLSDSGLARGCLARSVLTDSPITLPADAPCPELDERQAREQPGRERRGGSNPPRVGVEWASAVDSRHPVAVENDYNLVVFNLNELAKMTNELRDEVERRRLQEAQERLHPNETYWVNMLAFQLPLVSGYANNLHTGALEVLRSRPGEAAFSDQPPSAPDTL